MSRPPKILRFTTSINLLFFSLTLLGDIFRATIFALVMHRDISTIEPLPLRQFEAMACLIHYRRRVLIFLEFLSDRFTFQLAYQTSWFRDFPHSKTEREKWCVKWRWLETLTIPFVRVRWVMRPASIIKLIAMIRPFFFYCLVDISIVFTCNSWWIIKRFELINKLGKIEI